MRHQLGHDPVRLHHLIVLVLKNVTMNNVITREGLIKGDAGSRVASERHRYSGYLTGVRSYSIFPSFFICVGWA